MVLNACEYSGASNSLGTSGLSVMDYKVSIFVLSGDGTISLPGSVDVSAFGKSDSSYTHRRCIQLMNTLSIVHRYSLKYILHNYVNADALI